jgi:hypothetical protein
MTKCIKCVLDDEDPGVTLDEYGRCNWCNWDMEMRKKYQKTNNVKLILKILEGWKKRHYDCIIGVSGGCDSSYLLQWAVRSGLRPLAVNYDNTYSTKQATDNIYNITTKLGVDLDTFTVDSDVIDDINRAFIRARVPDIDAATDAALAKILLRAAEKNGVKYVLDAHDFRSEGTTPLGWLYFDGKYIESVCKWGGIKLSPEFPNLWLRDMLWYASLRIQRPRPMYYMNYNRSEAASQLHSSYGWQDYSGKHGENTWTKFADWVWDYEVFGLDLRKIFLSAQIRNGVITRQDAIAKLEHPPLERNERNWLVAEIADRLNTNEFDLNKEMRSTERRSHLDFETYLPTFQRYGLLFKGMARLGLIPDTFVKKYVRRT